MSFCPFRFSVYALPSPLMILALMPNDAGKSKIIERMRYGDQLEN